MKEYTRALGSATCEKLGKLDLTIGVEEIKEQQKNRTWVVAEKTALDSVVSTRSEEVTGENLLGAENYDIEERLAEMRVQNRVFALSGRIGRHPLSMMIDSVTVCILRLFLLLNRTLSLDNTITKVD